mgnify:CR=1 FL=1
MQYKRVLLKLSGEWFSGEKEKGFDQSTFEIVSQTIKKTSDTQLAIVLGGGNIFRGKELKNLNIDQVSADYIGMLSTIMNGIALSNYLTSQDCKNSLFSSFAIGNFVKAYSKEEADNPYSASVGPIPLIKTSPLADRINPMILLSSPAPICPLTLTLTNRAF